MSCLNSIQKILTISPSSIYEQKVSLPTIIDRAKKEGFYRPRQKERTSHDREILTNYIGEFIQHDSSHHKFSPYVDNRWYLITSLDDYSRLLLYARLVERELSWHHILALQDVFLTWGIPFRYYVDSHSIFRFVQGRDGMWRRPYRWLQDRIVRTCAREEIRTIQEAEKVLESEVTRYNYRQVHSTTGEIPIIKFPYITSNSGCIKLLFEKKLSFASPRMRKQE